MKISRCRVNTTSTQGIKQLVFSFGSFFFSFPLKVAGGNPWPLPLNDSSGREITVELLFVFYGQGKFGILCSFTSSQTLSKCRKEIICPEQFSPLAMSFAEQLLSGPCQKLSSLQYVKL